MPEKLVLMYEFLKKFSKRVEGEKTKTCYNLTMDTY